MAKHSTKLESILIRNKIDPELLKYLQVHGFRLTLDEIDGQLNAGLLNAIQGLKQRNPTSASQFVAAWHVETRHLSPAMRWLILMFLWPYIVSVFANLTTPAIQNLLFGPEPARTTPSNSLGSNPETPSATIDGNLRFLTRNEVNLREAPNTRSKTIAHLSRGQFARAIKEAGDWTFVRVDAGEDGAEIKGWVYSRFLGRFEKASP